MKVCAITVAIIFVVGLGLVTIGGCGGGLKDLANQAVNGELNFGPEDVKDWVGDWGSDWTWNEEWETYDINMDNIFNSDYPIIKDGEASQTYSAENIRNLKLELGGCVVNVTTSPDENIYVNAERVTSFQTYTEGDTLYVRGLKNGNWINNLTMSVELQLPSGITFDRVELSLGAGDFNLNALAARELTMEVGAGQLQIDALTVEDLECQLGAGRITMKSAVTTGNVNFEIGAGELVFHGSIPGNLTAECAMGNMELTITDSTEADHNFELECAAGNMTVGDSSYAGLVSEKDIDNGAASNYKLECAMGNLTVIFE